MSAKIDIHRKVNPALSMLSWLALISLIIVCKDKKILYFYMLLTILGSVLINSLVFKIFKNRNVSYDFVVYHYIMSLGIAAATFISTLKLAPYHRVFRSVLKLYLLIPSGSSGCTYKSEILEDVPVRIFTPHNIKSDAVIVYLHGGLFCYFNQNIYHTLMCRIASNVGCKVIMCGQKLGPEFPFPNAIIEAYQVVNWVQTNDTRLGINKKRLVVMGDDSGAALAAGVAMLHKRHQGQSLIHDQSDLQPPIAAQVLVYPILQAYSYGPNCTINPTSAAMAEQKSLFLSYYLAGNCSFAVSLGEGEESGDYPPFWKISIDDAVKTREPISELKPHIDGQWNEYAFPLMSSDPSSLPNTLIVGYVEDENFDDARYYGEWLEHHNVPVKMIRDFTGYHGNLLLHSISKSAKNVINHVAEYIDQTVC